MKVFGKKNEKVIDVEKMEKKEKAKMIAKKAGIIALTGFASGVCMGAGSVVGKEIGDFLVAEFNNLKA